VDRKFSYSKLDTILTRNSHQQEQQQVSVPKETSSNPLENIVSGAADIASGIGGLFDIQPSNSDAEDLRQQGLNKKKKPKKRKGFGFQN
jgi:hypothetical protein